LPTASMTEPALLWLRPRVPEPEPVLAVTVQVVPEPVTFVIAGCPKSTGTKLKAVAETPVTDSLKVTVQVTLTALVGLVPPERSR